MIKKLVPLKLKKKYWQLRGKFENYWHAYKPIFERNTSISNTILVAGSARSGTTWLGSVCTKMLNARPIFEPFILSSKKDFFLLSNRILDQENKKSLLMNFSLYIRPGIDNERLISQIEKILRGEVRSCWTDKEASCKKIYSKRVIKEVRANLLLNFLAHKWPEMKIIWIVRNPLKVIQSQLYLSVKYGWDFDFDPNDVLDQKQLVNDWLTCFIEEIRSARTLPERLMHRWCIENFVPFRQKVHYLSNVLLVSYEELLVSKEQWLKIGFFLENKKWDDTILDRYINKPSKTYVKRSRKDLNFILKKSYFSEAKLINIIKLYGLEKFLT